MTYDQNFLQAVNAFNIKEYSAAIMLLDFETEHPITRLEGRVVGSSMSIAAKTATRRTGSLQVAFDTTTRDLISIDKKISLSIGINNPFYGDNSWSEYRYTDILWFKQGIFIVTDVSSSISTTSQTLNLQFIDKMGMLNGVCGGTISSAASLHDRLTIDADGNSTTSYPRISQIIKEVVHHFGGEHYSKIIVDGVPDFGRQVVTWSGNTPVRFAENSGAFVVGENLDAETLADFPIQKVIGDDIGYMSTELTYPGELVVKAGTTVVGVLDEIVKTLGNFEYFYDIDGFFHFQQIRNYDKTGEAPINAAQQSALTPFNINANPAAQSQFAQQYLPKYSNDQYLNEFSNAALVASATLNPQYSNIKNDFVVWGSRKRGEEESLVRYHLAIDNKPQDDPDLALCRRNIWCVRNAATKEVHRYYAKPDDGSGITIPSLGEIGDNVIGNVNYRGTYNPLTAYRYRGLPDSVELDGLYYALNLTDAASSVEGVIDKAPGTLDEQGNPYWREIAASSEEILLHSPALSNLSGAPKFDWREELYRRALMAYGTSTSGSYYDKELLAEWRRIFNPNNKRIDPMAAIDGFENPFWDDFEEDWIEHFAANPNIPWTGYNVDVVRKPQNIVYWLDIIDTNSGLGQYSVNRIGRRTIVQENNKINEVLNREIPDIVFIDGTLAAAEIEEARNEYIGIGQAYCIVQPDYLPYFTLRSSFGTCYEEVRELLYTHLIYNMAVSLTTIPLLYLDVNKTVFLNSPEIGVVGNFVINQMQWNLGNMSTMSLSLNEAVTII